MLGPLLFAALLAAAPALQKCPDGPCRKLTADEREAVGARLLRLSKLLPLPAAPWTLAEKRCTAPDVADCDLTKGLPPTPGALCSFFGIAGPGGVFPLKSGLHLRATKEGVQVTVDAELLGRAAVVPASARLLRRGGLTVLERPEGEALALELIAGAASKEAPKPAGAPSAALGPVQAVRLTLRGPAEVVRDLAKRVDGAGLKALVGPVQSAPGAAR